MPEPIPVVLSIQPLKKRKMPDLQDERHERREDEGGKGLAGSDQNADGSHHEYRRRSGDAADESALAVEYDASTDEANTGDQAGNGLG